MMAEASVATRSTTVGPLFGQNRPDVPSGGLPTEEQVMQVNNPAFACAPAPATSGASPHQGQLEEQEPECAVILLH